MLQKQLKIARIGNSRGVRLPATTLKRYGIGDAVAMEERDDGILLRPVKARTPKLSFAETARAMAHERENWSEFDGTIADGLSTDDWTSVPQTPVRRVAEPAVDYVASRDANAQPRKR